MKNQWFIALKKKGDDIFDLSGITKIEPPKGTYWADPFLAEKDGRTYLFFEDYDYQKGIISFVELSDNGVPLFAPIPILERPYHLSFPFVVSEEGHFYLIPESGRNNTVEIYEFKNFPKEPELVRVLMRGPSPADVSVFRHEDMWWMWVTFEGDNNLFVFKSRELLGDWELYENRTIQNARNAGRPFLLNGDLIRPVQNCQPLYGHGIIFRKVTLNPYSETEVNRLEPDWFRGLTGFHTFNFTNKLVVVDGRITIEDDTQVHLS